MKRSFLLAWASWRPLLTSSHFGLGPTRNCSSIKRKDGWESVVGLEVHAQIASESKLFSPAETKFGGPTNGLVSLFDAAIPGTLPVLNRKCVEAAALTAMALSCEINSISWFDRKHYFYSDLPAGYQITQQKTAIANKGELEFVVYNPSIHKKPYIKKCRINQLQLEQDSGKSLHDPNGNKSLIDLNRAGIALMEIVFEPELKDGEEAGALVKELCLVLERIGTCSCKMEEGALRVDANISINREGEPLGTRTEVKNLSSIRSIVNAVEYEVQRQIIELENGRAVTNETRGYDAFSKVTIPMRDKEEKQDYRFMPEPNLPPLKLCFEHGMKDNSKFNISHLRSRLIELPSETRKRLMKAYGLKMETVLMIVSMPGFYTYYTAVMNQLDPKLGVRVANFISVEVLKELNKSNLTLHECSIDPVKLGELITILDNRTINFNTARDVMILIMKGDVRTPMEIVKAENLFQVDNPEAILEACKEILNEHQNLVNNFKSKGKKKHLNQIIDKVKEKTEGKYDMKQVAETVQKLLQST